MVAARKPAPALPIEPNTADTVVAFASVPKATGPDAARAALAQAIAAKEQRAVDIAANETKMERALDVLYQGINDDEAAAKILTGVKAQSLMGGGFDWRESAAVVKAQADVQDAQERVSLARTVIADLKEARERLDQASRGDDYRIRGAASEVVRTSPSVHALIAEATEKRRAWREVELTLGVIASHFVQDRMPGWDPIKIYDAPPVRSRDREWRDAIEALKLDAETPFPV